MDFRKFSLEYLHPAAGAARGLASAIPAIPDAWAEAIQYYGRPVLAALQENGSKTVGELFELTKQILHAPDLQKEQFETIVTRMVEGGQLSVVRKGEKRDEDQIGLPILTR